MDDKSQDISGMPEPSRFALVDEDGGGLCSFLDIEGFFVTPRASQEWRIIVLVGCSIKAPLERFVGRHADSELDLGNAEIRILDVHGDTVGAYFVGPILTGWQYHAADPALYDLTVEALLLQPPNPAAGPIWERWRRERPREKNEWAAYSIEERRAWLEVVRHHYPWDPRRTGDAPAGQTFELDGTHVIDEPAFYCALGEAINGPGGYFGANLDGLRDALRGGFGAERPFTLVWRDARVAQHHLDRSIGGEGSGESYIEEILQIFTEARVSVIFQ